MTALQTAELSEEEIAYHEAGHATAATVLPDARPVVCVTLDSELEGFRAHCYQEDFEGFLDPGSETPETEEFRAMVKADLVVLMAGPVSECRFVDQPDREHDGILEDFMHAQHMADEFLCSPEAEVQRDAEATAQQLVSDCWAAITAVAQVLLRHRALDGDTVREVIGGVLGEPPEWPSAGLEE